VTRRGFAESVREASGEKYMKAADNSVKCMVFVAAFISLSIWFSHALCFAADQPAVIKGILIDAATRRPTSQTLALTRPPDKGQDSNVYHDAMNGIKFSIDKSGRFTFTNVTLPGTYNLMSPTYGLVDIIRVTKGTIIDLGTISVGERSGG
jgi:hypothetical protein